MPRLTEKHFELADGMSVVVTFDEKGVPERVTASGGPRDGDWINDLPIEAVARVAEFCKEMRDEMRLSRPNYDSEHVCPDHGFHAGYSCAKCKPPKVAEEEPQSTPSPARGANDEAVDF